MTGFKNWEKTYEDNGFIEFQNQVTGVLTIVEGGDGEYDAYVTHPNPAVDEIVGESLTDTFFGSLEKARNAAREYRKNNTFEQYEAAHKSAGSAINSMMPDSALENDDIEIEVYSDEVLVTVNSKDFLENFLERDETCRRFQGMLTMVKEENDMSGYEAIQHLTGENVEYTYNSEVVIHPDFRYCLFQMTDDGEPVDVNEIYDYEYIAVQVHTGRDARVGFSSFQVFKLEEYRTFGEFFSGMRDVSATATSDHRWYSDDSGYNWHGDGDAESFDYDEIPDYWRLDEKNNKVYDRKTGEQISFHSSALMG